MSDFEDGDVYMSSHEHRFRMFSSVEYEGQLYMTPQNFIESVTMSEPRSMFVSKNIVLNEQLRKKLSIYVHQSLKPIRADITQI